MLQNLQTWSRDTGDALFHLAFPHICEGCGCGIPDPSQLLCLSCLATLPQTSFHLHGNNPVEKLFWGRLAITHATSQYYFTKASLMQRLMHQLKYKGNKEAGLYMGRLMGQALSASNRFLYTDVLVPLPLHRSREKQRGYNQATLLCQGISEIMNKPVLINAVGRTIQTESQTKKGRISRWQNIEGRFELLRTGDIKDKHVLLVDDVVTTGATLEACGRVLIEGGINKLSIATLCFSSH
jgi:ComF family protein